MPAYNFVISNYLNI